MSWQYYTMESHTLKEKTSAWAPNENKALTSRDDFKEPYLLKSV